MAVDDNQFGLTWEGVDAVRTTEPSCPHPYGGEPHTLTQFGERRIYTVPLAGYASQHSPDPQIGYKLGVVASRMREFDTKHRFWRANDKNRL